MDNEPKQNTNRELWRETPGDYYSPSLFVTKDGAIGMNVGGSVFVKSIQAWYILASEDAAWGQQRYDATLMNEKYPSLPDGSHMVGGPDENS